MFDLYLITDPTVRDVTASTRAALADVEPGRVAVQLRDKRRPPEERRRLGIALREVTRDRGAPLLVNGDAELALELGADGVHLPEGGGTPARARTVLGPRALVGVSCHDAEGLRVASRGGATFVTLAPFASSPGKGAPLGAARFAALAAESAVPVVALGGIDATNAREAMEAGAAALAVIRAVYHATNPARATRELLSLLDSARGETR